MPFIEPTNTKILLAKLENTFIDFDYEHYTHIKHGYDHDILLIKGMVYRFPKSAYYFKQLKSEAKLLQYLSSKINLSVPLYDYIAEDSSFARHPYIKGAEVQKTTFESLSKTSLNTITSSLASFLSVLHAIPSSKYKVFGFRENQYNKPIAPFPQIAPIHADLDINNMIWNENDRLGIIDFGDRCLFDPAYDFTVFPMFGQKFLHAVYHKYEGPKDPQFLQRVELYYQQYLSQKE